MVWKWLLCSIVLKRMLSDVLIVVMWPKWVHKHLQPPRGVPRKRCSENMQQIYRRTPMPSVLLLICCIFSEHLFVRTPLGGCFWTWKFSQYRSNHWRCSWNLNQSFANSRESTYASVSFLIKLEGLGLLANMTGLSGLIWLGGWYFRESLFRDDKNNVNITQTNFMRFIFSIKSICCSIVSFTV